MTLEKARSVIMRQLHWENHALLNHFEGKRIPRKPHRDSTIGLAFATLDMHALNKMMTATTFPKFAGTTRSVFTA